MDNGQKMEPPGMRAKRLGLERDAVSETYCCWLGRDRPYGASEGEIEHSKAISAKRIADALEQLARNDTHRTNWTGHDTAELRVGANADVRNS